MRKKRCACHTGAASSATRFLSTVSRPLGCTNALMKYLPFHYNVPRARRVCTIASRLPSSPFLVTLAFLYLDSFRLLITRRWIAPSCKSIWSCGGTIIDIFYEQIFAAIFLHGKKNPASIARFQSIVIANYICWYIRAAKRLAKIIPFCSRAKKISL